MQEISQNMYRSLSLTFFIRQSRASINSECTIYARLTSSGQRVELITGLKVELERWSKEQHKVKGNTNSARVINNCLEEFRNKVYANYNQLLSKGVTFSVFDIHNQLKGIGQTAETILNLIDLHNTRKKDLIGIDLQTATYEKYCTLRMHIANFPEGSADYAYDILWKYGIQLRIKKPRTTKLGDYRPPQPGEARRISINKDLNKFSFLVTFLHETAHLINFEKKGI